MGTVSAAKDWENYMLDRVRAIRLCPKDACKEIEKITILAKNIGVLAEDGSVALDFAGQAQRNKRTALLKALDELTDLAFAERARVANGLL